MTTSKDNNGNWTSTYKGMKITFFNSSDGWSYQIDYYCPIMCSNVIYFSTEDDYSVKTKKLSKNLAKDWVDEKSRVIEDFNSKRA